MVWMVSPPCYVNHSFLATAVPAAGSVPARKLQHGRILLDHIEHLAIGTLFPSLFIEALGWRDYLVVRNFTALTGGGTARIIIISTGPAAAGLLPPGAERTSRSAPSARH